MCVVAYNLYSAAFVQGKEGVTLVEFTLYKSRRTEYVHWFIKTLLELLLLRSGDCTACKTLLSPASL